MQNLNLKKLLFFSFVCFIMCSCENSNILTLTEDSSSSQKEFIRELGFDLNKVKVSNFEPSKSSKSSIIRFDTKEEAKFYFQELLFKNIGKPYTGNIKHKKIFITDFDIPNYIKQKLKEKNKAKRTSECASPYFRNCGQSTVDGEGDDEDEDSNEHSASATTWAAWCGFRTTFDWSNDHGNIKSNDFGSKIMGGTLGMTWEHDRGHGFSYPGSSIVHYEVHGFLSFHILQEGIGHILTLPITLIGTYNTNTGNYTQTLEIR
jgi:hypothetical protein